MVIRFYCVFILKSDFFYYIVHKSECRLLKRKLYPCFILRFLFIAVKLFESEKIAMVNHYTDSIAIRFEPSYKIRKTDMNINVKLLHTQIYRIIIKQTQL